MGRRESKKDGGDRSGGSAGKMFAYKHEDLSLIFWDQILKKARHSDMCLQSYPTDEKDPGVRWLVVLALSESPRSVRVTVLKKRIDVDST